MRGRSELLFGCLLVCALVFSTTLFVLGPSKYSYKAVYSVEVPREFNATVERKNDTVLVVTVQNKKEMEVVLTPAGADTQKKQPYAMPNTADLVRPFVHDRSRDSCAEVLGIQKVALMFMTRGPMPQAPTWRLWFESAIGVLPAANMWCRRTTPHDVTNNCQSWMGADEANALADEDVIDRQHLFNVYVHIPPSANLTDVPRLFQRKVMRKRVETPWGSMGLVHAARLLLWEAYKDPANTRFLLASESDVPLYDVRTYHHQLTTERASRTSACRDTALDLYRWNSAMHSENLQLKHFRKASQWFTLTREHAYVVLSDVSIFRKFESYCFSGMDPGINRWRNCYGDEHYFPTLLAARGMQQNVNCDVWGVSSVDWGQGGAHPRSYKPENVTDELIDTIRTRTTGCGTDQAIQAAEEQYELFQDRILSNSTFDCSRAEEMVPVMKSSCHLNARKFPADTAAAVLQVFTNCSSTLRLLPQALCNA